MRSHGLDDVISSPRYHSDACLPSERCGNNIGFLRQTTQASRTSPPRPSGAGQLRKEEVGGLTKVRGWCTISVSL